MSQLTFWVKSDIFSFGISLLELVSLVESSLYFEQGAADFKKINQTIQNLMLCGRYSPELIKLLCKMINYSPEERPDWVQLYQILRTEKVAQQSPTYQTSPT
jgi:serine/threonine protein kinase